VPEDRSAQSGNPGKTGQESRAEFSLRLYCKKETEANLDGVDKKAEEWSLIWVFG
jgi:hypothetical protein